MTKGKTLVTKGKTMVTEGKGRQTMISQREGEGEAPQLAGGARTEGPVGP